MANWKHTINLQPEWQKSQDDELPVVKLLEVINQRFRAALPAHLLEEVEPLLEELTALKDEVSETEGDDVDPDEFDEVWDQIYNWADVRKVWINTL